MARFCVLVLLAALLAGCSGGSSASTPVPVPSPSAAVLVPTVFTFQLPPQTSSSSARRPEYITANIESVRIVLDTVNGNAPPGGLTTSVTTNLTLSSCPCAVPGPQVPPGTDVFTITTYDAQSGGGNVVSTASPSYTIVAGAANSHTVTLDGVPASFTISGLPSGTAGTAFGTPQSFTLSVKDADNNVIIGTYANSVTISDSDTSSLTEGTALAVNGGNAATSVTSTSSSDTFTLSYGGLAIAPATLTASASGATSGTATFTPTLQPIVYTPGSGANGSGQEIDFYATSGTGSSGSFTVSEVGFSNSPYDESFTESLGSGCSTIATASPSSGTTFTATAVGSPSAGSCTLSVADGGLHSALSVTLTYTTYSFGVN
ncbi:MAG TPA: hypothetical protein VME66_14750 [Candidatus Acidoferrales bacterium]|nr:hypothetical protein [Candidatus Acidoferrales bacterium]